MACFRVHLPVPAGERYAAVRLVPRPDVRQWGGARGGARCAGTTLIVPVINRHIHGFLFNHWGASVRVLGGDRGGP